MAYELRIPGAPARTFASEPEAIAAARAALQDNADVELEIIDLTTGKPAAPGASRNWREELKSRVGF